MTHAQDPFERAAAERYSLRNLNRSTWFPAGSSRNSAARRQYLDIVGVNFYSDNQWFHGGPTIPFGHHDYRPLADLLSEVYERYQRPLLISETGAEGSARAAWLHYVCGEVRAAMAAGVPVLGCASTPFSIIRAGKTIATVPLAYGRDPMQRASARSTNHFVKK